MLNNFVIIRLKKKQKKLRTYGVISLRSLSKRRGNIICKTGRTVGADPQAALDMFAEHADIFSEAFDVSVCSIDIDNIITYVFSLKSAASKQVE